jgi:transcription termination factor Rho
VSESTNTEGGTATAVDTPAESGPAKRRGSGLSSKLLPELQQIAGDLGISGTAKMRKSELIAAIQGAQ